MSDGNELGTVVLTMARRGPQINDGAAEAFYRTPGRKYPIACLCKPVSTLLTYAFNQAWAAALDMRDQIGARYFAMIHDDIEPDPWWLDTLLDELVKHEADAVSAVMPIKSEHGLTSTAINLGDIWTPRRLTMTEVMALPETFGADDAGGPLLLNTGLWVCDLTKQWADDLVFDFENRIVKLPSGKRAAQANSEDWLASHHMNQHGAKLLATRKVSAMHNGSSDYPNNQAWGAWKRDELYFQRQAEREARESVCA